MKNQFIKKLIVTATIFFLFNLTVNSNTILNASELTTTTPVSNTETTSEQNTTPANILNEINFKYELYPNQVVSVDSRIKNSSHKILSYAFSKNGIATYKDNKITALKKGKTKLTITYDDNLKHIITIHVKKGIKKIDIPQKVISLNKKDTRQVFVNINSNNSTEPLVWKSSNKKIVTVNKNGEITGKKNGTAYVTCMSKYGKKSDRIKVKVKKTKYIAFTFDDGPSIYTKELLEALKKYNSKATFFVLGERVDDYSDIMKKQKAYGHQIGNHSYDHPILPRLNKKEIKQQINKTNKLIKKQTDVETSVFRPPYGSYNNTVKKAAKAPIILWSVDTLDWKYRNSSYVKNAILSNADDGDIVLMHDIYQTSVDGFIQAIKALKKDDYELVTVSELFKIKGKKLKDGEIYYFYK